MIPGGSFFFSAVLRIPAVALAGLGVEMRDVGLPQGFNPPGELEKNRDYFESVGRQIQAIIDERDWTEVTFVAKSIGTMILGLVGAKLSLPSRVNALWLTPTFSFEYTRAGAMATRWRSLIVSGSADRWYDADMTRSVAASLGAQELLVEGGDHNLEIAGDYRATLRALDELATATLNFVGDQG